MTLEIYSHPLLGEKELISLNVLNEDSIKTGRKFENIKMVRDNFYVKKLNIRSIHNGQNAN